MSLDFIQDRLSIYELTDRLAEENAIKEICQEIIALKVTPINTHD